MFCFQVTKSILKEWPIVLSHHRNDILKSDRPRGLWYKAKSYLRPVLCPVKVPFFDCRGLNSGNLKYMLSSAIPISKNPDSLCYDKYRLSCDSMTKGKKATASTAWFGSGSFRRPIGPVEVRPVCAAQAPMLGRRRGALSVASLRLLSLPAAYLRSVSCSFNHSAPPSPVLWRLPCRREQSTQPRLASPGISENASLSRVSRAAAAHSISRIGASICTPYAWRDLRHRFSPSLGTHFPRIALGRRPEDNRRNLWAWFRGSEIPDPRPVFRDALICESRNPSWVLPQITEAPCGRKRIGCRKSSGDLDIDMSLGSFHNCSTQIRGNRGGGERDIMVFLGYRCLLHVSAFEGSKNN